MSLLVFLDAPNGGPAALAAGFPAFARKGSIATEEQGVRAASPEDAADIAASLKGNGEAYARLVGRHQGRVASWLWRFTRERGTLEELVQEVFVEAYFSLRRFRGDAAFERWLHVIAVRVGYRHIRHLARERKRSGPSLDDVPAAAPARDGGADDAEARELHRFLDRLPPRDRLVLTLLYLDDRSVEETAQLTGWSRTMVKVQAHRARGKLKKMMAREGIERGEA